MKFITVVHCTFDGNNIPILIMIKKKLSATLKLNSYVSWSGFILNWKQFSIKWKKGNFLVYLFW